MLSKKRKMVITIEIPLKRGNKRRGISTDANDYESQMHEPLKA